MTPVVPLILITKNMISPNYLELTPMLFNSPSVAFTLLNSFKASNTANAKLTVV